MITELEVGEALVSVLDEKGSPTIVERALILPPHSRLSPLTPEERSKIIQGSTLYGHYEKTVDRESAFEKLKARTEERKMEAEASPFLETRDAAQRSPVEDHRRGHGQECGPCHWQPDRAANHPGGPGLPIWGQSEALNWGNCLFTFSPG